MPYGDTESNYHRLGELNRNYESLRAEFLSFQQERRNEFAELKQEIVYLNERISAIEAVHNDIFSLDLEALKERKDNLYDSLETPISDITKAQINTEIVKIERLISLRMKK